MGDLLRLAECDPDAEIVGVCDESENPTLGLESTAAQFGLGEDRIFTNHRACIEETVPDIAFICAVPAKHAEWVEKVAAYDDVHPIVETPFATSLEQAEAMVETAVDEFGGVDVLVNNAGIFIPGDTQEITPEEWDKVIGVDLDGTFLCSKYAIPHLKERAGSIVNVGSVNSSEGGGGPPYAAAKGAIPNLTRDFAVELGEHDVTVNAICPGFVETAIQDYQTKESMQAQLDHTLLPRGGTPEDVGDVAVFLTSEEASFVHGQSIYVDGGWSAHRL